MRGVPIDADHEYVGDLLDLLNPYALLGGLTTLALFLFHGAVFLALKTAGDIRERARRAGGARSASVAAVLAVGVPGLDASIRSQRGRRSWSPVGAALALLGAPRRRPGSAGRAGRSPAPRVTIVAWPWRPCSRRCSRTCMPSTLDAAGSLTVTNAASTPYTLKIMTWVRGDLHPDRAALPGLDVLGVPQAHRRGQHPAALTDAVASRSGTYGVRDTSRMPRVSSTETARSARWS